MESVIPSQTRIEDAARDLIANPCDRWPCLVDPPRAAAENMEIDEALLRWVENTRRRQTLVRFYRWAGPTVSLGRHQKPEESVDLMHCRQAGICVVNRPTGGRAVFHHDELTYAIVSNDPEHFPLRNISKTYHLIAAALKAGLEHLGLTIRLAQGSPSSGEDRSSKGRTPCFLTASRHELLLGDRKIVGNAQKRLKGSFLQHGSIPIGADYTLMAAALGSEQKALEQGLISVSEALGSEVSFQALCQALIRGFEQSFGIRLVCSRLAELGLNCDFLERIASE